MTEKQNLASLLVLIGDVQRTMLIERLLGREQNDAAREKLLVLAGGEQPEAFFFLGDLVAVGCSTNQWDYFDRISRPVFTSGRAVHAVYGNHDYFGGRRFSESRFLKRFTKLEQKWNRYDFGGGVRVLALDSNRIVFSRAEWAKQLKWYEDEIARADADPSVRGVLTFVHHPPFTNSRRTKDIASVKNDLVPALMRGRKTMALCSGHVHAYEKFRVDGKLFIVSGGGGGPRVGLHQGARQRHADLFSGPVPRPFHYIRVELRENGLDLVAIGINSAHDEGREFDRTSIDFPTSS